MEAQLERDDLSASADIHFRFALGKAYEDRGDYDRAWHYYHSGNQRQRGAVRFDPANSSFANRHHEVFSREFLEEHAGNGDPAADPIFIVGLPRSGSTLIEQILASHSQVEGTSELPILGKIAVPIGRYRRDACSIPRPCGTCGNKDWRAYGQQYLEETRRHRSTERAPFSPTSCRTISRTSASFT